MSDQGAGDEASRDQIAALQAFEAQFKPEDFAGVAQALRLPEEPETLCCLRNLLLPEFRLLVESCSGAKATREEKISRLEKLRGEATALEALLGPGGTQSGLSRRFWGSNLITDQFTETLRVLALEAGRQIQRLRSSPGKRGRRRKDAARQLGKDLIRVYEKLFKWEPAAILLLEGSTASRRRPAVASELSSPQSTASFLLPRADYETSSERFGTP
jgi:hypothetical protein